MSSTAKTLNACLLRASFYALDTIPLYTLHSSSKRYGWRCMTRLFSKWVRQSGYGSVLLFPKPRSLFCYSSVGLELPDLWTRTKYVTKSSRTIPCSSVKIRYIPIVFCLSESDSKVRRSNHMCLPFNNLKYQHHLVISRSLPCPLNEWSGVSNDDIDELWSSVSISLLSSQ
jgi:hypothetical protein